MYAVITELPTRREKHMKGIITLLFLTSLLTKMTAQSSKISNYHPDWTFYFTNVDDKLSSIATDLNLAKVSPIKGQDIVIYISIKMKTPREDGLSRNTEADQLWQIEDQILTGLKTSKLNFSFAGKLTSDGLRDLYFFGEDGSKMENLISNIMENFPTYRFDIGHKVDKEWEGYFNFLYPIPRQMEQIQNRRVVEQIEKGGDSLTKEREVFHWIYFKTQTELDKFEMFSKSLDFKTLNKNSTKDKQGYKFVIQISRLDKVGYNDIDEYTLKLWEKAQELNGDYDGWETSVQKQ